MCVQGIITQTPDTVQKCPAGCSHICSDGDEKVRGHSGHSHHAAAVSEQKLLHVSSSTLPILLGTAGKQAGRRAGTSREDAVCVQRFSHRQVRLHFQRVAWQRAAVGTHSGVCDMMSKTECVGGESAGQISGEKERRKEGKEKCREE